MKKNKIRLKDYVDMKIPNFKKDRINTFPKHLLLFLGGDLYIIYLLAMDLVAYFSKFKKLKKVIELIIVITAPSNKAKRISKENLYEDIEIIASY